MSNGLLYQKRIQNPFINGWFWAVKHYRYSLGINYFRYQGTYDFSIYFFKYEFGISKLPYA
tara:strand:- start:4102 stop:4284 length:183 start_codon:yes stop_codon:yes gene_type:complete